LSAGERIGGIVPKPTLNIQAIVPAALILGLQKMVFGVCFFDACHHLE